MRKDVAYFVHFLTKIFDESIHAFPVVVSTYYSSIAMAVIFYVYTFFTFLHFCRYLVLMRTFMQKFFNFGKKFCRSFLHL